MTQAKQLKGAADLTPIAREASVRSASIADIATAWGVSEKTIANWCEFVYQAFEVMLPSSGPYPGGA